MVVGAILTGIGGFVAGKSSGGGIDILRGFEFLTKKEEFMQTISVQETYSPTTTTTYDYVFAPTYAIDSAGVTGAVTKKEQAITQTPTTSPSIVTIPTQLQGAGQIGGAGAGAGAGFNIWDAVLIAGIVAGGYFLIKKIK